MAIKTVTRIDQSKYLYECLLTGATGFGQRPLLVYSLPTAGKSHVVKNVNDAYGRENGIAVDFDYRAPKSFISTFESVKRCNSWLINSLLGTGRIKLLTTFVDWTDVNEIDTRNIAVIIFIPDISVEEAAERELRRNNGVKSSFYYELVENWDVWKLRLITFAMNTKIPCKVITGKGYLADELTSMFASYNEAVESLRDSD